MSIGLSLYRGLAARGRALRFCTSIGSNGWHARRVGHNPTLICPGVLPELAGYLKRVNAGCLPPGLLVARAMDRAMMRPAERDRELVARLTAQRARLDKSDVMGIRGLAAAEEARLVGHKS